MESIIFEDGYKEFTINNDPDRTIRFNPSDVGIAERFREAYKAIDKRMSEKREGDTVALIGELDAEIKAQIDFIFNQPVSEKVFGRQSPMAPVGGKMLFERFLEAVLPVITESIEKERKASSERIGKYVREAEKLCLEVFR